MAKKISYAQQLRQEMQEVIDQLDLPDIRKQALQKRWLDQVLWLDKKSTQCRNAHYRLRLFTIIGGVLLPALVTVSNMSNEQNLDQNVKRAITTAPFVLSISIAIAAAVEEFCRFGDRWRQYRQSAEALKSEGWQYLQGSGPYAESKTQMAAYPLFASRVESIIQKDVEIYVTEVAKERPKEDNGAALPEGYSPQSLAGTMTAAWTTPPQIQTPEPTSIPDAAVDMPFQPAPVAESVSVNEAPPAIAPADPIAPLMPTLDHLPVGDPDDPKPDVVSPNGASSNTNSNTSSNNGLIAPQPLMSAIPPAAPPAAMNGTAAAIAVPATANSVAEPPLITAPTPVALPQANVIVKVAVDTVFKQSPKPSDQLPPEDKVLIKGGSVFGIQSFAPAEGNHVKMALMGTFLGPQNRNTWYVYSPHVEMNGTDPDNKPDDKDVPPPQPKGKAISLPGVDAPVYLAEPIIPDGNFTWAEATKNGTRIPDDKSVVDGIIRVAKAMEEVRSLLGDRPITVNSWYRDPSTNRRVGGARDSRHMRGDAVDFVVSGISPAEVHAKLDAWWGNRGGLASASSFTHIDTRGVKARWRYSS